MIIEHHIELVGMAAYLLDLHIAHVDSVWQQLRTPDSAKLRRWNAVAGEVPMECSGDRIARRSVVTNQHPPAASAPSISAARSPAGPAPTITTSSTRMKVQSRGHGWVGLFRTGTFRIKLGHPPNFRFRWSLWRNYLQGRSSGAQFRRTDPPEGGANRDGKISCKSRHVSKLPAASREPPL